MEVTSINNFYVSINGSEYEKMMATKENKLTMDFIPMEENGLSQIKFTLSNGSTVEFKLIKEEDNGNTEG